jgi:gas vesicle protein
MSSNNIALGILGGIAAGAIAGILLAPNKGSKTKKKIVSKSNHFADDLKEKFEDLYENVTDKYENLLHNTNAVLAENKVK